ncbi:hypothetical protein FQR65_LT06802 [Abscondita terminalis]|nr:hypothetical protein FQR65_LT06802 [Abscondita terminalis]
MQNWVHFSINKMRAFIILIVVVASAILQIYGGEFVCDSNKVYQENKCNNCSCSVRNDEVLFACTKMACSDPSYYYFRRCHPKIPIPCDNCWCIPTVGIICEL